MSYKIRALSCTAAGRENGYSLSGGHSDLKVHMAFDLAVPLLGMYPKEVTRDASEQRHTHEDTCQENTRLCDSSNLNVQAWGAGV